MSELQNSAEFFKLVCECNEIYSPAQNKECPKCKKSTAFHKELKFDTEGFLEKISTSDEEDSLDIVLDAFYQLWAKFDVMNDILKKVDVTKLTSTVQISILTCTFKYSDDVSEHEVLFKKVYDELIRRGKTPEESKNTLQGLEGVGDFWIRMKSYGATGNFWGPRPKEKNENN